MGNEEKQETAVAKYQPSVPARDQVTLKTIMMGPAIQQALAEVVPKHLTAERIIKMVLVATSRQPKLLQCTQESILKAAMTSGELGLDCSGTLGRAYLVPFMNRKVTPARMEAQFMAGYLGLMDLARRSGEIDSITAEVVYEQDVFVYEKGLEEKLVHRPDIDGEQLDKDIIGAYMISRFRPSGHHVEFMTRKQIEKVRARSKAATSGPWVTDYAAMCKKTVIRAGLKFCPLSIETQHLIAKTDDEFSDSIPGITTAPTITLTPTDGRQPWGFSQEAEPEPDIPNNELGQEQEEPPANESLFPEEPIQKPKPAAKPKPEEPKAIRLLRETLKRRCEQNNLSEQARREAEEEMLKAGGVSSWKQITGPDIEDKCMAWLDAMYPEKGDEQ